MADGEVSYGNANCHKMATKSVKIEKENMKADKMNRGILHRLGQLPLIFILLEKFLTSGFSDILF